MAQCQYRKAADRGNDMAQNNLGVVHATGLDVSQNDVEAAWWYRMVAKEDQATAHYGLVCPLIGGRSTLKSKDKAARFFSRGGKTGIRPSTVRPGASVSARSRRGLERYAGGVVVPKSSGSGTS